MPKFKESINIITIKNFREIHFIHCRISGKRVSLWLSLINPLKSIASREIESAEIPNPNHIVLLNLAKTHMIHRPYVGN